MEREAAHSVPFISWTLLRAEMFEGMSRHGQDYREHTSLGESAASRLGFFFFQDLET